MPYITSVERIGMQRGIEQGIQQGIQQGMEQGMEQGSRVELLAAIELGLELRFGTHIQNSRARPLIDLPAK
ncbi:hypothetical protein [Candidatus Amarolinea dominans]|uniref:hypothetical protein n=1 Tax=Candidatus Amarolinea dominans TaxID=3140696 RepID=UPI001DDA79FF|nr:hypothetical protein [Anaerolineae bacterium]